MKIINVLQNSPEWLTARAGIPTASEFHNLVTPAGQIRKGETVETYYCRKLAERWFGGPLPSNYSGGGLEQGTLRQNEAVGYYETVYDRKIKAVGFITTDDGRIGCSPDGMFDDGTGIEGKCPDLHTQVKYLLKGELPTEYVAQVQGCMFVTGAPRWVFVSRSPILPMLVLTVERDEAFIESLHRAIEVFLMRLDEGYKRLVALNNGQDPNVVDPDGDDGNTLDF
jgi:hypothetical protein